MHRLKPLISRAIATLLSVSLSSGSAITLTLAGTIVGVGDGDTIRVKTTDKTLTVRLACVDAPEMKQQLHCQTASSRLKQLLPVGQSVTLQITGTDS
jgi:micrococcal nuclease